MTPRTAPMFGPPGHAYVYFVYGMHHCANVVARAPGDPAGAVLLRGAEPVEGAGADARRLAGPALLARALGLTTAHSGLDLVHSALRIHDAPPAASRSIGRGPRVGLTEGETRDAPWRYWIVGSPGVSRAGGAR